MIRPADIASPIEGAGALPVVSQPRVAEARLPGWTVECPLCEHNTPTYLHPIDSRQDFRAAIYGSDVRPVTNILVGCEHENHYLILEIATRKGEFNMGFRAPYDREIISEWRYGSFDNSVNAASVRFNPDFEVNS